MIYLGESVQELISRNPGVLVCSPASMEKQSDEDIEKVIPPHHTSSYRILLHHKKQSDEDIEKAILLHLKITVLSNLLHLTASYFVKEFLYLHTALLQDALVY